MISLLAHRLPTAIRTVDLSQPVAAINDLSKYGSCRIFVFFERRLLGKVDIQNGRQSISPIHLCDAICRQLLGPLSYSASTVGTPESMPALIARSIPGLATPETPELPDSLSVSIIIATYDRPTQLDQTLKAVRAQITSHKLEIVVVDNHPSSGLTPPIVDRHPGVLLVSERRQGLAYARNAGFVHSSGAILVTTDDDVTMPNNWIELLVAPFKRSDVAAVTGNVLPLELETESQYLFEEYGGLGRGFKPIEAGAVWLKRSRRHAAPTWKLGATANAAFRASTLRQPQVGLMDEALGPGMPSGVGEDTYLFYKIIQAGFVLIYNPDAYVWHTHRRDREALRKQIFNYSKGHVAYHLTTLIEDHDRRAAFHLLFNLPRSYLLRIKKRLRGKTVYPITLILLEIWGNFLGPFSLWRSRRRVSRLGRSRFWAATNGHVPKTR